MSSVLQRYTANFQYGRKEIPFYFWSHQSGKDTPVDTVIFLGSGQRGRVARWVAANTPDGTVTVEGLPHKIADRSAHDLRDFAQDYTNAAFSAVLKTLSLTVAHVVAESQAAPGVVWMALDNLPQVKNVVLIAPLGFTAHILGTSPKGRLKELKRRAFRSSMQSAQSPLYDWRNLYLNVLMLQVMLFDARWGKSGQKYAIGASHDIREDCRKLAVQLHRRNCTFTLVLGEQDRIFPSSEIETAIKNADIKYLNTIVLKTSHASLAIRNGKNILRKAVMAVRQLG